MTALMKLINSDAEKDIHSLLEAAEDADALIIQPMGESGVTPGKLPLCQAATYSRLGACRALLAKASPELQVFYLIDSEAGSSQCHSHS